jgi:hypothetical protein
MFVPVEVFVAGGRTLHTEICKFMVSIWNKEELPDN